MTFSSASESEAHGNSTTARATGAAALREATGERRWLAPLAQPPSVHQGPESEAVPEWRQPRGPPTEKRRNWSVEVRKGKQAKGGSSGAPSAADSEPSWMPRLVPEGTPSVHHQNTNGERSSAPCSLSGDTPSAPQLDATGCEPSGAPHPTSAGRTQTCSNQASSSWLPVPAVDSDLESLSGSGPAALAQKTVHLPQRFEGLGVSESAREFLRPCAAPTVAGEPALPLPVQANSTAKAESVTAAAASTYTSGSAGATGLSRASATGAPPGGPRPRLRASARQNEDTASVASGSTLDLHEPPIVKGPRGSFNPVPHFPPGGPYGALSHSQDRIAQYARSEATDWESQGTVWEAESTTSTALGPGGVPRADHWQTESVVSSAAASWRNPGSQVNVALGAGVGVPGSATGAGARAGAGAQSGLGAPSTRQGQSTGSRGVGRMEAAGSAREGSVLGEQEGLGVQSGDLQLVQEKHSRTAMWVQAGRLDGTEGAPSLAWDPASSSHPAESETVPLDSLPSGGCLPSLSGFEETLTSDADLSNADGTLAMSRVMSSVSHSGAGGGPGGGGQASGAPKRSVWQPVDGAIEEDEEEGSDSDVQSTDGEGGVAGEHHRIGQVLKEMSGMRIEEVMKRTWLCPACQPRGREEKIRRNQGVWRVPLALLQHAETKQEHTASHRRFAQQFRDHLVSQGVAVDAVAHPSSSGSTSGTCLTSPCNACICVSLQLVHYRPYGALYFHGILFYPYFRQDTGVRERSGKSLQPLCRIRRPITRSCTLDVLLDVLGYAKGMLRVCLWAC